VDSVWEIFGPLLRGVQLVLIPEEGVKDADRLVEILAAHRVTRIVVVPSLLRTLLSTCPDLGSRLPHLRHWVTSGEALPVELCRSFTEKMPQSALINLYGSSEVSADATCYDTRQQSASTTNVPIGNPIANTRAYILDRHSNPVPIGVPGELHIGGEGLARGYLNRPELTAERFIPDPYSGESGSRLYRSGDLTRYLPDGNIEFLGRIDHQVKIRGFRIELGEIETVLDQHPAVRDAVVSAREGTPGDEQLVAYVVPGSQPRGLLTELRGYLQKKLPEYMVPSAFVVLEALPLTPNGKVDRKALPAPDPSGFRAENSYAEPRTPVEEQLVEIWEEVLGLERVGIHDNFFELGGHSLLATRVVSRVRKVFQVELPLLSLFEEPTVAGLAERIKVMQQSRSVSSTVVLGSDNLEELRF
jgi:acyl-coenzyme A synthetase/AMP-(fatty) acid ligase/acyl carrier protein